jgi:hypothetical protein
MALQVLVGIATLASCRKFVGHATGIFRLIAVICLVTGFATLEAHSIERRQSNFVAVFQTTVI